MESWYHSPQQIARREAARRYWAKRDRDDRVFTVATFTAFAAVFTAVLYLLATLV